MTLSNLRQRIRSSSFVQALAPAMLGSVLLLGSSCSNVREFAAGPLKRSAPLAKAEKDAGEEKVKHALAGQSESDSNFIKLLQHKMSGKSSTPKAVDQRTGQAAQASTNGENLIVESDDPFLHSTSRPEPAPANSATSAQSESIASAAMAPTGTTASTSAQPPVVKQAAKQVTKQPVEGLPESSPKPFVDTNVQLTSAEEPVAPSTIAPSNVAPSNMLTDSLASRTLTSVQSEPLAACPPEFACPPLGGSPFREVVGARPFTGPEIIGDEYLHDGGDRGTKVYYSDGTRYGLDIEDTVVEWTDETGVARVKPSTRASIYAPRFGAVRSASLPHTDVKIAKAAGHQDQRKLGGIDTQLIIDENVHNDEAIAMRMRSRSSGVESKSTDNIVHQNQTAGKHVKLLNVYEDFRFFREGQFDKANNAVIGQAIEAAFDWNGDLGVIIYANDISGQVVQGRFTAQDYTGVEDRSKPGDLTITKVVDKSAAKPGDELTFTIRFDNIGDRPLRNVRVVDNLSPRLEYIDDSVDASLDGKLDTESNGRGSQVLSFTFDNELKGHTGGWVSFKCRVR
ncbi:DUF11 domain-containing protein [Thalassoglobus polymorphus]|uniref:DUF11 domain-containing protein n=1 Tax=Thalassoglobus polymorphus TaxID=2527994 RepID=A0A517QGT9_9PLAN|nr:DUF11 domain-containing protein [Thalassoglobus polymorphus]QDT30825.1 hypothetical protein Mal48_00520 [Thalassoglobus polymorphus]